MRQHCPEVCDSGWWYYSRGGYCQSDCPRCQGCRVGQALSLGRTVAFGEAGASKAIRILKDEIETTMAVLGLTSLDGLDSSYLLCHTNLPTYRLVPPLSLLTL